MKIKRKSINVNGWIISNSDSVLQNKEGVVFDYLYESNHENCVYSIDARSIINPNYASWLNQIEIWHRRLSEYFYKTTKLWALTHASRLILWPTISNFELKPILFTAALMEYLKENSNKEKLIFLKNCPDSVWESLHINYLNEKNILIKIKKFKSKYKSELIFWLNLCKEIIKLSNWLRYQKKFENTEKIKLIISYLNNSNKNSNDHYYGDLNKSKSLKKDGLIWVYVNEKMNNNNDFQSKSCEKSFFLLQLVTPKIILDAIIVSISTRYLLKILSNNIEPIIIDNIKYEIITRNFINKLILEKSILFEYSIKKILINLFNKNNVESVIYPYEEKPFERAVLLATSEVNYNVKTIAFAHAAYSDGHLYINRSGFSFPEPSKVALTGKYQENRFIRSGWQREKLQIIGSPRNIVVNSKRFPLKNILLIIGYGFELRNFKNWALRCKDLSKKFDIKIRKYPYAWDIEQREAESVLRKMGFSFTEQDEPLSTLLLNSQIVLYESTSAAFEASFYGNYLIKIGIHDTIVSNHFGDMLDVNKVIPYCKDIHDLIKHLNRVNDFDDEETYKMIDLQKRLIKTYYDKFSHKLLLD